MVRVRVRDRVRGRVRVTPWRAPIWDAGASGRKVMPGLYRKHAGVWDEVVLQGNHLDESLGSYVWDGIGVHEFLVRSHKGTSVLLVQRGKVLGRHVH